MVPRLVLLPDPECGGLGVNAACSGDRGAGVLRAAVRRAFLAPDDRQTEEELRPHDFAQFRRLAAAIWHDLGGLPRSPLTFQGPSLEQVLGISDEKEIRDRLKEGRTLWASLAAWPWTLWPNGRPPTHWHRLGPDAEETAVFYSWQEGELVRSSQIDARI